MTAQPPTSISVGTVTYDVLTDQDSWIRIEHERQRKGDYGYSQHTTARIYVNPDAAPDVQRLTLWHEVLHCVTEVVSGSVDFTQLGDDKEAAEETVVRTLEHGTLAALRDNPALVKYLLA